jgi:hypothetical protein
MPNWCHNKLTITGPEKEVAAFKQQAGGHSPWLTPEELKNDPLVVLNFHSLVPVPEEVLKSDDNDAGYSWVKENWGCKWGAANSTIVDEWAGYIQYEFDTAWSPPMEFVESVAKSRSNLVFILEYEEPGMRFKGLAKFQGEVCEDHCVSL